MRTFFVVLVLTGGAGAQSCAPHAAEQAAAATLQLQQRLLATSVPDIDTDVPASIKPVLHNFKEALVATVDTALRCNDPAPAQLQTGLAALLHANKPARPFTPQPASDKRESHAGVYGDEVMVVAKPVPGQPNLFSIQVGFDITCGDDNILLLYRRTPAGYVRELSWFNPDINTVGDAHGGMFLAPLVPSDQSHPYLVAVVHGTPWCTSTMSLFHVDLLSPAVGGKPEARLAHLDQGFRIEDDPKLKVTSDGFELRVTANDRAMSLLMRPGVFRYRTTAGTLERVQPIANNARDFVDEWLQVPWLDAARWSDPASTNALKAVHDRFDYGLHRDGNTPGFDDYGPVRACTSAPHLFQAEIGTEPALYARIRQDPAAFVMLAISPQPDPTCAGPDLMKKR